MAPPKPTAELGRRVREADAKTLLALLAEYRDELDVPVAQQALRNPFVTPEAIDFVVRERQDLLAVYELRRDVARHPRTREVHALRLVAGLFWRDLARICGDAQVPPSVRRAAEKNLVNRMPALALGEKIALARMAAGPLLAQLVREPQPRVVQAALLNSRLTERLLLGVVTSELTAETVLKVVAQSPRWSVRRPIRLALVRNGRTPLDAALGLITGLDKDLLRELAREPRLRPPLRTRVQVLLGRDPSAQN